jgi:hypothetical protein
VEVNPFTPAIRCASHDGRVELNDPDVLFEVRGWVERRKGGGVHHVRFKEQTGRIMCGRCARQRARTGHEQQESML